MQQQKDNKERSLSSDKQLDLSEGNILVKAYQ
ncbi:Uncharacterised protein [Yersinia frederiksenii]|nr:Uncharacterised protein [Yersinia frederiksenii]